MFYFMLCIFQNVLKKKIEAIVDCYLDTASPPWLQVRDSEVMTVR